MVYQFILIVPACKAPMKINIYLLKYFISYTESIDLGKHVHLHIYIVCLLAVKQ